MIAKQNFARVRINHVTIEDA
jgi:hypothetical protein